MAGSGDGSVSASGPFGAPHRLVVVGSVLVDVMLAVERWPERGGDLLASAANVTAGGGFVVLTAARRLGLPAALLGRVGDGAFGAIVAQALAEIDVPVLPDRAPGDTGFTVGLVEPDGERTFVTSPGTESRLTARDLDAYVAAPGDVVYVSGYDLCYPVSGPALTQWLSGLSAPALVLDPGPLVADIPDSMLADVLRRTTLLTLNEREAGLLAVDVSTLLTRLAPGGCVVLRRGADGCDLFRPDGSVEHYAAPRVDAVDSTGAGDTHTGALLAELARTGSLGVAAHNATVAAALSVTRWGSATGPTRAELDAALA